MTRDAKIKTALWVGTGILFAIAVIMMTIMTIVIIGSSSGSSNEVEINDGAPAWLYLVVAAAVVAAGIYIFVPSGNKVGSRLLYASVAVLGLAVIIVLVQNRNEDGSLGWRHLFTPFIGAKVGSEEKSVALRGSANNPYRLEEGEVINLELARGGEVWAWVPRHRNACFSTLKQVRGHYGRAKDGARLVGFTNVGPPATTDFWIAQRCDFDQDPKKIPEPEVKFEAGTL